MITQKNVEESEIPKKDHVYVFPSEDEIYEKADELFAVFSQGPQRIFINTSCIVLHFYPRVFVTRRDRQLRDDFFQWIIDQTRVLS